MVLRKRLRFSAKRPEPGLSRVHVAEQDDRAGPTEAEPRFMTERGVQRISGEDGAARADAGEGRWMVLGEREHVGEVLWSRDERVLSGSAT
jgi:hypothetical protein